MMGNRQGRPPNRDVLVRRVLEPSRFAALWWLTVGAGAASLVAFADLQPLLTEPHTRFTFAWLLGLALLSESRPVVASRRTDGVVLSWAFLFAILLFAGVQTTVIAVAVSTAFGGWRRGKRVVAVVFNVAQWTVVYVATSAVLTATGWTPLAQSDSGFGPGWLPAFALAVATYHVVNILLVGSAIALFDGRSVAGVIREDPWHYAWTTSAVLALSPVVLILLEHHWAFLPLLLLPLSLLQQTAAMSLASEQRSLRDPLTGLGNRLHLAERFRSQRTRGRPAAICVLDLDGFKLVNDTLGHEVGDAVLTLVAARLATTVRPGDTVTRLGGDEFVLLLDVASKEAAAEVAERVMASLQQPFEVHGHHIEVGASCGIALLSGQDASLDVVLRQADHAMYAAKRGSGASIGVSPDGPVQPTGS